jgi:D-ribose pyranase
MLASLGHTDELLICDAGFPIPAHVPRIDLAYRPGAAPFLDVLGAVVSSLHVEGATIASEVTDDLGRAIDRAVGLPVLRVPHASVKDRAQRCRGAVRTGEYTAFANVVLTVGVAFPVGAGEFEDER